MVGDYRHTAEITSIYAEPSGRRIVLVDSKGEGYLYNPKRSKGIAKVPLLTSRIPSFKLK
ncbi:WD repeat-containing protein 19 [Portunus trituberculatus]|uniref:WD repeat-containing protein 19 n=1 Tax=Portunus trituberculatus TaxID=210409 RepID=A0A5B7ITW8_PORTR|nr:WD repeat-containing protein 19 [Portunus trituberculatus]